MRRLLFFIPSLFIITLFGFVIAVNAPGDPVQTILHDVSGNHKSAISTMQVQEHQLRHRLGLDLPVFYFSMHSVAEPDTLYKVWPVNERAMLVQLVRNHGNWPVVSEYYQSLKLYIASIHSFASEKSGETVFLRSDYNETIEHLLNVQNADDEALNRHNLFLLNSSVNYDSSILSGRLMSNYNNCLIKWEMVLSSKPGWRNYAPAVSFHLHNQFNRWLFGDGIYLKGILHGDFGVSFTTLQPVSEVLKPKIKWSLLLSFLSLVISLSIAIPVARYSQLHPKSIANRFISAFKNFAFATPVFWFATLLLMLFANPSILKIFPASGVQPANGFTDESFFHRLAVCISYLILPLVCYSYASAALLAATVQSSLRDVMKEEYIKTAFAKGLNLKQVVKRHAIPNALLPLITLVANFFPAALGGSVIIENIFSIPGMGNEIVNAVFTQNYPVIVAIVTITGFLTLTGYLVADMVYRLADPRIRFGNEN